MTNLDELISITDKLSTALEKAASEEKRFCVEICLRLEQLSWEMLRTCNEIQSIKQWGI